MEKSKRKLNPFFRILFLLFIIYCATLIAFYSGYYENKLSNKTVLTNEAMERFEDDIKNGKVVDIKDYLKTDSIDYSNSMTRIGDKVSNGLSTVLTKGIGSIFGILKGLFW